MNQFICIFFTSFISLFIYIKYFCKKKNSIDNLANNIGSLICYYFLSVLTNILLMYFILYFRLFCCSAEAAPPVNKCKYTKIL